MARLEKLLAQLAEELGSGEGDVEVEDLKGVLRDELNLSLKFLGSLDMIMIGVEFLLNMIHLNVDVYC